jgi:hypothetical protein
VIDLPPGKGLPLNALYVGRVTPSPARRNCIVPVPPGVSAGCEMIWRAQNFSSCAGCVFSICDHRDGRTGTNTGGHGCEAQCLGRMPRVMTPLFQIRDNDSIPTLLVIRSGWSPVVKDPRRARDFPIWLWQCLRSIGHTGRDLIVKHGPMSIVPSQRSKVQRATV